MSLIIDNIDEIKQSCIERINGFISTIPFSFLEGAYLKETKPYGWNTRPYSDAKEAYQKTRKGCFYIPMTVVLNETVDFSKRYKNNKIKVNVYCDEKTKEVSFNAFIENIKSRSLETLLNYVKAMCDFMSPLDKIQYILAQAQNSLKEGDIIDLSKDSFFKVTVAPYVTKQDFSTKPSIVLKARAYNSDGTLSGYESTLDYKNYKKVSKKYFLEKMTEKVQKAINRAQRDINKATRTINELNRNIEQLTNEINEQKLS